MTDKNIISVERLERKRLKVMTMSEKERIIAEILSILQAKIKIDTEKQTQVASTPQTVEMLTLKECTEVVKGLSEHSLRLLVTQGQIPAFRTGEGKNGKILVSKQALLDYFTA